MAKSGFSEAPMSCPTCRHRKSDGILCGSPALHGQKYCFFHSRQRRDAVYGAKARRRHSVCRLDLPALDDPDAIHTALSQLIAALAADTIDYRRAGVMLSTLRFASN